MAVKEEPEKVLCEPSPQQPLLAPPRPKPLQHQAER